MANFSDYDQFAAAVAARLNKPPRYVDGSEGITSEDVKEAILAAGLRMEDAIEHVNATNSETFIQAAIAQAQGYAELAGSDKAEVAELLSTAEGVLAATAAFKIAAENAAANAAMERVPLGDYNASTNTPTLSVTPGAGLAIGAYYEITAPGSSAFGGSNFTGGTSLAIGGRLTKKNATQWFYTPPSDDAKRETINLKKEAADRDKTLRYLNRFNRSSLRIIAGYINSAGNVTSSGAAITEGVTVVTDYIAVSPGETLFLSAFSSNNALLALYDASLAVVTIPGTVMASTFTVPDGVDYIRFSIVWRELAYISPFRAMYFPYGLTMQAQEVSDTVTANLTSIYNADLAVHSGMDNLISEFFTAKTINDVGEEGNSHPLNRISNKIPVRPGVKVQVNSLLTLGTLYIAEYSLDGKFVRKQNATKAVDYTTAENAYYMIVGFHDPNPDNSSVRLSYVDAPPSKAAIHQARYSNEAKVSEQLKSTTTLRNIALFNTITSANANMELEAVADGVLLTTLTETGHYAILDLERTISAGDVFQVGVDYEVIDHNCTSFSLRINPYFVSGNPASNRTVLPSNNALGHFTIRSRVASGTNFTLGIQINATGSKTDPEKPYFVKLKVKDISVLTEPPELLNIQSIESTFGPIAKTKHFSFSDLEKYDRLKDLSNFKGYNLVRIDGMEQNLAKFPLTIAINNTVSESGLEDDRYIPPALVGMQVYRYIAIELTLNDLTADYTRLRVRTTGGDNFPVFSRADIGKRKTIYLVTSPDAVDTPTFLHVLRAQTFTGGVANTGFAGLPNASFTVHSFSVYASEKLLPEYLQGEFFERKFTQNVVNDFVREPITELTINGFGDSITEHNYMKYIQVPGYKFNINIYGLRSNVTDILGAGTGACNTYTVMTDNADIVLTLLGTHDFGRAQGITLGDMTDVYSYNRNTLMGAFAFLIRGLTRKYPGKILLIGTIMPRNLLTTDNEYLEMKSPNGIPIQEFNDAIRKVVSHFGVHLVDFYNECGVNRFNMTGSTNLYIPETATDNSRINASGDPVTDNTFFLSDYIAVQQGKEYISTTSVQAAEFDSEHNFIRISPSANTIYLHPNTAHVRVFASKSTTVINNTVIGVTMARFWFAEKDVMLMQDRIHPGADAQKVMGAAVSKVLAPLLQTRKVDITYRATLYNNAD